MRVRVEVSTAHYRFSHNEKPQKSYVRLWVFESCGKFFEQYGSYRDVLVKAKDWAKEISPDQEVVYLKVYP